VTGALASDRRHGLTFNGVQLRWSEPADACQPSRRWLLFPFKPDGASDGAPVPLARQSAFLVGRDKRVADVWVDEVSVSGQHAVVQFRAVPAAPADFGAAPAAGAPPRVVRPYVMDLESTNGTWLNGTRLEPARYVELRARDVLRFGASPRELVLMHDGVRA
jgi:smad nuclear-interacting protein 1